MHRFEHLKPDIKRHFFSWIPILAFVLLFLLFMNGVNSIEETTQSKQLESLRTAITRSVTQCYAVEGFYPSSLDYLVAHYGITYDADMFLVDYEYCGNNLFPEITILRKQK